MLAYAYAVWGVGIFKVHVCGGDGVKVGRVDTFLLTLDPIVAPS